MDKLLHNTPDECPRPGDRLSSIDGRVQSDQILTRKMMENDEKSRKMLKKSLKQVFQNCSLSILEASKHQILAFSDVFGCLMISKAW